MYRLRSFLGHDETADDARGFFLLEEEDKLPLSLLLLLALLQVDRRGFGMVMPLLEFFAERCVAFW